MFDVQPEIIYPVRGELTPGAGHESRAKGSHQPEKYLGSRTMSSSSLWGDLVDLHKEKWRLSVVGLGPRRDPI